MFHLCLRRRPETFLPAERGGALPAAFVEELRQDAANTGRLLGDAFGADDLFDLIHCLAAEVEYPGRRLEGERRIGVDAERQPLRREALGTLLMMASELALDPTSLDGVLLSHLGTNDPLEPTEILETLDRAQWNSRGSARLSLDVTCRHPAVDQALRLQVDELSKRGAWLQRILESEERNALKPLRGLRWLFDVDELKPEKDEHGQPRYTTPHLRFHLAQDEVRELLLGERIYNDPSLAIREMYQNALDACRYRQAREEYLKRKGLNGHLPPWEGQIVFRQWTEKDGREILECEDNGIGMGRRELETCFARAGRRFADTPEYLEEEAEWHQLDPPIRLYPNSQFGIGVFSYFLLADEIEVFTRRFEKDGRPGKVLHVQLSGSGSLFRIRELEDGGQPCGCRIRLTLAKKGISCLKTLRELLWRAEFSTRVCGGDDEEHWAPDLLKPPADFRHIPAATQHRDVFWLFIDSSELDEFITLADGLLVSHERHNAQVGLDGVLVDFNGDHRPKLTLDRRNLVESKSTCAWVPGVLVRSSQAISSHRDFSASWLWKIAKRQPKVAASIAEWLMEKRQCVPLMAGSGREIQLADTGFFEADSVLADKENISKLKKFPKSWRRAHLEAWRRSGLPLSQVVEQWLDLESGQKWYVPHPAVSIWVEDNLDDGRMLSVLDLLIGTEWTKLSAADFALCLPEPWSQQALDLLEQLGEQQIYSLLPLAQEDLIILSTNLAGARPWLNGPVAICHVWAAADQLHLSVREVLNRLSNWAAVLTLELPSETQQDQPEGIEKELLKFLSPFCTDFQSDPRLIIHLLLLWLEIPDHRLSLNEGWAILGKWWAALGVGPSLVEQISNCMAAIQSKDAAGLWYALCSTELTPGLVWDKAGEFDEKPWAIYERICRLEKPFGLFHLELPPDLPEPRGYDWILLHNDLDKWSSWLERGPVDAFHMLGAAEKFEEPVSKILRRLGPYIKPFGLEIPEELYRMP